jgi:hypothetical protein
MSLTYSYIYGKIYLGMALKKAVTDVIELMLLGLIMKQK